MLTNAVEENQQREPDVRPSCTRMQCLRCRSEVTCREEGEEGEAIRRMRKALMLTGGDEDQDEEEIHMDNDTQGERDGHKNFFVFQNFLFFFGQFFEFQ